MFTLSLHLLIKLRQTDVRQDDALAGIHRPAEPAGNDFDPLGILGISLIIFIEGPDALVRNAGPGRVGRVGAKGDIDPRSMALIAMTGLVNAAFRVAADAQHQGHEFLQWNLLRTFFASKVELGGLSATEVVPEMIPFMIGLNGRNRLPRKKGDPVQAVKTPFRDQVSIPDIGHRPFVMTADLTHEDPTSHEKSRTPDSFSPIKLHQTFPRNIRSAFCYVGALYHRARIVVNTPGLLSE